MIPNSARPKPYEYKLVFADQGVAEVAFHILAAGGPIGHYTFRRNAALDVEDIYYDTKENRLRARKVSLRIRTCGGKRVTELKAQSHGRQDLLEYLTRSWPIPKRVRLGKALCQQVGELAEALRSEIGSEVVADVGSIRTARVILEAFAEGEPGVAAVVCLDRFSASTHSRAGTREGMEIEVKGNDPRRVVYLGQCLCNWFGMIRVTSSKLERYLPDPQQAPRRLLLDMDPGIDDALALLHAGLEKGGSSIEAITIVGGNANVMQCARNAYRMCAWMRNEGILRKVPPVGIGRDLSERRTDATNVHGADALGDLKWPGIDREAEKQFFPDALELGRTVLSAHPGEITVVATGPCSNLAKLVRKHPKALLQAREIIAMGGAFFDCGNRSPGAEFNIHADSVSARSLLEFCRRPVAAEAGMVRESVPLTFVGLDVTHRVILWKPVVEKGQGDVAKLVLGLTAKYMDFYSGVLGPKGCPLHDPLAVALALRPEYCVRERYHVEVVTTPNVPETDGITIADYRPAAQFRDRMKELTQVCVSVDSRAFLKDFCTRLGLGS